MLSYATIPTAEVDETALGSEIHTPSRWCKTLSKEKLAPLSQGI